MAGSYGTYMGMFRPSLLIESTDYYTVLYIVVALRVRVYESRQAGRQCIVMPKQYIHSIYEHVASCKPKKLLRVHYTLSLTALGKRFYNCYECPMNVHPGDKQSLMKERFQWRSTEDGH